MKIKPELACFINAWERLGSKIDFAYVIIDMEFIERYFDYYNLSGEEVEQIALTLAESEYRCIELLAYLVGVGKSWSEFREAFYGYMFDIGDQTLIVTPKCKYPYSYSYSYETKKCDCSRRRKNIRIFDSDKVCLDAPLSYLLDISKALSGYEYRGCAVVHDELQEFVWEFLDTFDECDGEEGLFIGSNSYELLDGYVTWLCHAKRGSEAYQYQSRKSNKTIQLPFKVRGRRHKPNAYSKWKMLVRSGHKAIQARD